jgi:hypothetical protein
VSLYQLDLSGENVTIEDGQISADDPLLNRFLQNWLKNRPPGPADGWPSAFIVWRLTSELGAVILSRFDDEGENEPESEDGLQTVY